MVGSCWLVMSTIKITRPSFDRLRAQVELACLLHPGNMPAGSDLSDLLRSVWPKNQFPILPESFLPTSGS
jgi:hypothetical protein